MLHDYIKKNTLNSNMFLCLQLIFLACGGTVKGITFKDLLCSLVLLTRGNRDEKIKCEYDTMFKFLVFITELVLYVEYSKVENLFYIIMWKHHTVISPSLLMTLVFFLVPKVIFGVYANESGSHIVRSEMLRQLQTTEGGYAPEVLSKCFGQVRAQGGV